MTICTLPSYFLSSQFTHNTFVVPDNRNRVNFNFGDLGLPGNKPLINILHLPESKRKIIFKDTGVINIVDDKYANDSSG
jgi:hypothetical protein